MRVRAGRVHRVLRPGRIWGSSRAASGRRPPSRPQPPAPRARRRQGDRRRRRWRVRGSICLASRQRAWSPTWQPRARAWWTSRHDPPWPGDRGSSRPACACRCPTARSSTGWSSADGRRGRHAPRRTPPRPWSPLAARATARSVPVTAVEAASSARATAPLALARRRRLAAGLSGRGPAAGRGCLGGGDVGGFGCVVGHCWAP